MKQNTGLTDKQGQDIFEKDILVDNDGNEYQVCRRFGGWYIWAEETSFKRLNQEYAKQFTIKA